MDYSLSSSQYGRDFQETVEGKGRKIKQPCHVVIFSANKMFRMGRESTTERGWSVFCKKFQAFTGMKLNDKGL